MTGTPVAAASRLSRSSHARRVSTRCQHPDRHSIGDRGGCYMVSSGSRGFLERSLAGGSASPPTLPLEDGSRIAVLGGGPAGSFFSYFLLEMASRVGIDLSVDMIERKSFDAAGPAGCNMCGGIISESLVQ